nr:cell wall hydrolase [Lachnospiraceae bacterium]
IYCEAGNQCYAGKLAVGIVVMNRVESKVFPNTIKGVLYQPYQFTPARTGALSSAMSTYNKTGFKSNATYKQCLKAAKEALSGSKSVTLKGKKKSLKGYHFFSRYVAGCRLVIQDHQFK